MRFSRVLPVCAALLLSGCIYYPFTYHTVEPDHLQQPFTGLWAVCDPGMFSFSITDNRHDLRNLKVVSYSFYDESGKSIPISRVDLDRIYGKDFAIVQFFYDPKVFQSGQPFRAVIDFNIGGERAMLRGEFSEHSHTKIEYLPEVLDHG